jgi:hypothetical protein
LYSVLTDFLQGKKIKKQAGSTDTNKTSHVTGLGGNAGHPMGMLFHKHAKMMHLDGKQYRNMYWAYGIVEVADWDAKTYRVRFPDDSQSLMGHDEIAGHLNAYQAFHAMIPGTFCTFTDYCLGYYCTHSNDSPDCVARKVAQMLGLGHREQVVSQLCHATVG